eukprot:3008764-Amphidinium_carterae.2
MSGYVKSVVRCRNCPCLRKHGVEVQENGVAGAVEDEVGVVVIDVVVRMEMCGCASTGSH